MGRAGAARRLHDVRRTAKRTARNILSQYADSSFRPLRMEFVFGQNGLSPIVLELSDGTFVYFAGTDRPRGCDDGRRPARD